ncbi:H-NS histone family protein (plasmid) [Burkholderia sp. FERM BP-3421]|uniref:H-NS family nucleoid-associated regulatory protein n=1 Tax=Burkholderia sp. FERM BP-3421 TaxID=1494466 RepID=UPI002362F518|nr:H-NS family nucleoid-associated regulatory protein [Burkholderia sp. FERM BP-3421]WDD90279.1 H-NS histone family protein [Burkholderia sp. FERM BP-3421]
MTSKTTGYVALVAQLEALDAQIKVLREVERDAAIEQIKALMKEFDISVVDLQERGKKCYRTMGASECHDRSHAVHN